VTVFFPLAATIISAAFAYTVGMQYERKRRPYLLAWCAALTIYALATLLEVIGAAASWNLVIYRAYYLLAAILLVGVLGLGTIYLLIPRFAAIALGATVVLAAAGCIAVVGAQLDAVPLHSSPVPPTFPPRGNPFNLIAVLIAATTNIVGTLVLVGGALWSAYGFWRRSGQRERAIANVLIAAGALVVAFATGLSRLGIYQLFYSGQAIGVLIMFLGFLTVSRAPMQVTKGVPATS
jgi:hypothetical protein